MEIKEQDREFNVSFSNELLKESKDLEIELVKTVNDNFGDLLLKFGNTTGEFTKKFISIKICTT